MARRYWFEFSEFQKKSLTIGVSHGCGFSAYNYDSAIALLKEKIFLNAEVASIEQIAEVVNLATLDSGMLYPIWVM